MNALVIKEEDVTKLKDLLKYPQLHNIDKHIELKQKYPSLFS